jgi:hypothetical protein
VTAADLAALATLIGSPESLPCGADADGNGLLESEDWTATIRILFSVPPEEQG